MRSKNFVKAAQGTHPPKSGNFGGSSVIKYSFLPLKLPHIFTKLQVLVTKPGHDLYDSHCCRTTSVPRGMKRGRVRVKAQRCVHCQQAISPDLDADGLAVLWRLW
jgi:hypothetical protein